MRPVFKKILGFAGVLPVIAGGLIVGYVRAPPLVFNESLLGHAHCIKCAGFSFRIYATDHGETFPCHTNGYGDALLLTRNEVGSAWACLTGPGDLARVQCQFEPLTGAQPVRQPWPECSVLSSWNFLTDCLRSFTSSIRF